MDAMLPKIVLERVDSTNTWAKGHPDLEDGTMVACIAQTAGRGQRGNSWEAEPGLNITMTVVVHPRQTKPSQQFAISRAAALAVSTVIGNLLGKEHAVRIKWPNDIYVGDKKIAGILIEHVISPESIERSIIGVGINVNQKRWLSDAPNPISLYELTGREYDVDKIRDEIHHAIVDNIRHEDENVGANSDAFWLALWRREGFYPYTASGEEFEAEIAAIDDMGRLTLRRRDGSISTYAFKEVAAKIWQI